MARAEARSSILTRVLVGFLAVILGFGAVAAYSAFQHHRSVETLRLINQTFLSLTLDLAEIRATQSVFGPILDRLLEEQNPRTSLDWFRAARPLRALALRQAREKLEAAGRTELPPEEARFLAGAAAELAEVARMVDANEARFAALDRSLSAHDTVRARGLAEEVKRSEREVQTKIRRLVVNLRGEITQLSDRAQRDERTTLLVILGLAAAAMAVGVLVTVLSHRMLSPLRRLQEGAEAVARGDLSQRLRLDRTDEIGALAKEFDRMIDALQARDAQLRTQSEELVRSERLAAIGKMAAHITHEVRNPLSAIGLNAELLEEEIQNLGGGETAKEAKALLRAIAREVDRLTALTRDYLRLARVPEPVLEPVDLGALIRSVLEFAAGELREAGVTAELRVSEDVGTVSLDEGQVRQVLMNLVRNAREAMKDGGTLSVEADARDAVVEVAVTDTGPGVPPEERSRVFDPFHTTKQSGTGLGLSLAMQLVRGHGGDLRLESPPGGGARFVVRLPRVPDPAREEGRAEDAA